ncbi:MAG: L-threonylcarbamoyladenylate synthase [Bacillota bacterium]
MAYNTSLVEISQNLIKKNEISKISKLPVLKRAKKFILNGELVAFPTETVYGLGADATNGEAVKKIFKAKGRPQDNPLIAHIANLSQFEKVVDTKIDKDLEKILNKFWPGPLTVILPKSKMISNITTANLKTVGVRMPSHPVALSLIEVADRPLAAPSANTSGFPSPTRAEHVFDDLSGRIPLILGGGACEVGVESTIIKVEDEKIIILRPGGISREELAKISERKIIRKNDLENNKPLAPGMKYKHYSPRTSVILYTGQLEKLKKFLHKNKAKNIALAFTTETIDELKKRDDFNFKKNIKTVEIGSKSELKTIANRLFYILRELDKSENEVIIIEKIPERGIGEAVMNRLYKAASKKL